MQKKINSNQQYSLQIKKEKNNFFLPLQNIVPYIMFSLWNFIANFKLNIV